MTTDLVNDIKMNPDKFYKFIQTENFKNITFLLKKLGRLSYNIKKPLLYCLNSENSNIRYLAIKNLAKLSDYKLLNFYETIIKNDTSSNVRREAASAIGRLRNKNAISSLINLLDDNDPEVVMQAIRGLLVFKKEQLIKIKLQKLLNHPNEIIRELINKEFNTVEKNENLIRHDSYPVYMKNTVVHGDVRSILKLIPDESIHLTFTSPPYYNARDYSIYQSYDEYLNFLDSVFKEVHRVTKEGRFFILNTSPIIIPRVGRQHSSKRYPIPYDIHPYLIKMGWEFIDDILWVKPEASVKNRNAGFLMHRKPLAYKANSCSESVMVYRKKTDKLIDWNIKQYDRDIVEKSKIKGKYETRNIWNIDPTFDKTHSAVFPIELCNRIIKFYSFIGDLVFDPFGGSGTFGRAALENKRNYFLTEIDNIYIDRIKEIFSNLKGEKSFLNMEEFKTLISIEKNKNR